MSNPIATFEKVSLEEFKLSCKSTYYCMDDAVIEDVWNNIKLPARGTAGSAGYDFYLPLGFFMIKNKPVVIPTGIRAKIEPGWFLMILPRSGLGFKYGARLVNTAGIIDSDYYNADNEGHIMIKFDADDTWPLTTDTRFAQGIFVPYGTATNDETLKEERSGGFGSTGA